MIFLHPLALVALAAAAIPALLHLFQRRTPPEAPVKMLYAEVYEVMAQA